MPPNLTLTAGEKSQVTPAELSIMHFSVKKSIVKI